MHNGRQVNTDDIKILRVEIDKNIQESNKAKVSLGRDPGGREIALVVTKLEEAKMWAGKVLGEMGRKLPEEYRDEAK